VAPQCRVEARPLGCAEHAIDIAVDVRTDCGNESVQERLKIVSGQIVVGETFTLAMTWIVVAADRHVPRRVGHHHRSSFVTHEPGDIFGLRRIAAEQAVPRLGDGAKLVTTVFASAFHFLHQSPINAGWLT
jgi:hypothetical protein